jgi:transcriptional regulator with XRE-family HTH domain
MSNTMLVLEIIKIETELADLSDRIKQAREKAGLSGAKCSELVGVSRQYFSQLENNRLKVVAIELIRKIESVTNQAIM